MAYRSYRPRSRPRRRKATLSLGAVLVLLVAAALRWLLAPPEAAAPPTASPRATPVSAPAPLPPKGTTFACASPFIHDGDNIRCQGGPNSRLYGIDAPEMKGACRPGRQCTPGDPIAARDHLRALVSRGPVMCEQLDTDRYQRPILRCTAGGVDLSCAQVASGHAVERYGKLQCGGS